MTELQQALASHDFASAERVAHSAKSVNGNIGASGLQEMAAELERLIHDGADSVVIQAQLATFADVHGSFIASLKQVLPNKEHQAAKTYDETEALEILKKLAALLAKDDSKVMRVLEENLEMLRAVLGDEVFARMDHAIQQYDFDEGLRVLKERAAELGYQLV